MPFVVVVVGFLGNSAAQIGLVREVRLGESWGPGLWMGVGDGLPEAEGMGSRWSQPTWRWTSREPKAAHSRCFDTWANNHLPSS